MHAESAAVSISRMRRTVVRAAAMLALVAAPAAAQQRLDTGGLVYGLVGRRLRRRHVRRDWRGRWSPA